MKNKNTFGVHFLLRQNRPVEDKYPVYVRIVVNKTRTELALKLWVKKEDWNSSKGMAKAKSEELVELNSYLEKIRGKIASHYRELDLDDNILTAEMLKNAYLGAETLVLIKDLMKEEKLKNFDLVGGTSLSLQIGHRKSIDIDLFTSKDFDSQELKKHLEENSRQALTGWVKIP